MFIESGGDNLAATFSPELADLTHLRDRRRRRRQDPAQGRARHHPSDLLVINKTDLAPHVGASLEVMDRDATTQRGERPFVFTCIRSGEGVEAVAAFVIREGMLDA